MKGFTRKQQQFLDSLELRRAREVDVGILRAMTGPVIDGCEQRNIIDCFLRDLPEDRNGHLASFIVMSSAGLPLAFFSLRCGELFKEISEKKMKLGHDAYRALKKLSEEKTRTMEYPDLEENEALRTIRLAHEEGLTFSDIRKFKVKKEKLIDDVEMEMGKDVTRVLESYPAVELKLFGINASAKNVWNALGFQERLKMGETLFWTKIVGKIEDIRKNIGCRYLYLFAADTELEGGLVNYYRTRLKFSSDLRLAVTKPYFDWLSQFLYQDINELIDNRGIFLESSVDGDQTQ